LLVFSHHRNIDGRATQPLVSCEIGNYGYDGTQAAKLAKKILISKIFKFRFNNLKKLRMQQTASNVCEKFW